MATTRPRRRGVRRAFPILALVAVALGVSIAVGPKPSSGGNAGTAFAAASSDAATPVATAQPTRSPRPSPTASPTPDPTPAVPVVVVHPPRPAPPSLTAATRRELQLRLDGIRTKYALPGISATIILSDGTSWVGTSGLADVAAEVPVRPETAFAIASVSKTFTAALTLALAEEGKFTIDDRVRAYLPDLELDRRITIRQLLDHTSGLRDYFFHPRIDRRLLARPDRRWDEARALRYVGTPYFKPGRGWHYSNTNYLVLGLLAERVTGRSLGEELRDRFFEPLGLRHTWYQPTDEPTGPVAHGYRLTGSGDGVRAVDLTDGSSMTPFTSVVTAAAGAGAIASTSTDLARWARALYGGEVLSGAAFGEMIGDAVRTEQYAPAVRYGLGVQFVEVGGRAALGHSGRLLGARSVIRWLPAEQVAVAVLTNQSRTDPGIVARALLRIALRPATDCDCGPRR
ncbi:MAG TPA: serine hydrolase domain-containing protein [Candidatus Limnocylindrales bacterium]